MKYPEIIISGDGSHTLKVDGLDEHYHSTFGAISESMHVFIEAGLKEALAHNASTLNILEVGFGTGLNALLTLRESMNSGIDIRYMALETMPLDHKIWAKLNYPEQLKDGRAGGWFKRIHQSAWNEEEEIVAGFFLNKIQCQLQDYITDVMKYDLIYFDAFAPDVQAELWTEEIFHKIVNMTNPGGILVTYSAKGSVRRALQSAGFKVERIPGPRGKREMMRGVKR